MSKAMKQRDLGGKEIVMIGAKVDHELHGIIKQTALDRSVSMSMIVEEAVRYYVENVLNIDIENQSQPAN